MLDAKRAADASSILAFLEAPISASFDLAAEDAIGYFSSKGLKESFSYADMTAEAHQHAFTVAKMMDVDLLGQVRASLEDALANGVTFKDWGDTLLPTLQASGWWGKQDMIDPLTGKTILAQLGSPSRLETIFRTNMQTSYAVGQWREIESQQDIAPLLMYDAVDDFRTRPLHRAWHTKVLPVAHAWWKTHYPPNGWNCRCGVIQISEDEAEAMGLKVSAKAPAGGNYTWKNPRTGKSESIPKGLDPGFNHNAGAAYLKDLQKLLGEKVAALPPSLQKAAAEGVEKAAKAAEAQAAVAAAQQALAKAEANAALVRAQAKANEAAKNAAAQAKLDQLESGKNPVLGDGLKKEALKALAKTDALDGLTATEKLAAVELKAAEIKLIKDTSANLSLYKKAILEGKNPQPAWVKSFNSLDEEKKAAFLAKIDAEKAAATAAKAAEQAKQAAATGAPEQGRAKTLVDGAPPDPATMTVTGRKTKGGTDGAFYTDTATGQRWLVKFNGSADAVQNEVLAGRLYSLAGVEAPELHAINIDGKPALASRIIDDIAEVDAKTLAATPSVTESFAVDAWLANWDVVGMDYDNIVLVQGRAVRIDVGGSLRYRALGGLKGSAFGKRVTEIDSLRDGTNDQARNVFGAMSNDDIERSAEKVIAIADEDIRAVVMRYGPPDATERAALADLMVARKADLEKQFPAAARRVRERQGRTEPPKAARITAAEQERVEQSRVNGYGFPTDSDQIEDNMVVVNALKREDGTDATRGWLKLTPDAAKKLEEGMRSVNSDGVSISLAEAKSAILKAVRSINFRFDMKQKHDAKSNENVLAAIKAIENLRKEVSLISDDVENLAEFKKTVADLDVWHNRLNLAWKESFYFKKPTKPIEKFDANSIPNSISAKASQNPGANDKISWARITDPFRYKTARFDRSFAQETSDEWKVRDAEVRYEGTLPDGTKLTYFPAKNGDSVVYSLQGIMQIDVPGKGIASTEKVFDALKATGVNTTRASDIDRRHLYLNAFARLRLIRFDKVEARGKFSEIKDKGEQGLKEKLALLKEETGTDIEKSEGWRRAEGVHQAFGHGRAYQLRPDLDTPDFAAFENTYTVFHNPTDLDTDGGFGVFERLKPVIEGGGMLASMTDRIRRGIPLTGSSETADMQSGGGGYVFTRIFSKRKSLGAGLFWSAKVLKRMDAVSYNEDMFGRVTDGFMEAHRQGQTVESFKEAAKHAKNETIFKSGLSLFDDLEKIVLKTSGEVNEAIAWMKAKGYTSWPDGRPLEAVIVAQN